LFPRSSALHLTLVIPGLAQALEAAVEEKLRLPKLERIISQARSVEGESVCYETLLCALFGLGRSDAVDAPLAAVMYPWDKGATSPSSGWWLRADPVYLQPDRDQLVLWGPPYLGLNEREMQLLAQTVAPLFAEYGWRLEAVCPERWYLCLPQAEAVNFTALSVVQGKYIGTCLPAGPKARPWRALLNEIQMSLHDCPANREREKRGAWPVNSLWFWGAGEALPCPPPSWRQVGWFGEEPLIQALAAYCGVPGAPVAQTARMWLANNPVPGEHLLVLDSLGQATGFLQYREALLVLENNWFSVLYSALRRQTLASVTLYPLNGRRYSLSWTRTWRLWQRARSL
jgi:hypothetical protein